MSDVDHDTLAVSRGQVAIMVTRRCNMTCAHCSVESGPKTAGPEPDEETLVGWVRQAAAAGVRAVRVTGGEPMLRPKVVLRVLRECRRLGVEGAMTTNGFWGRTPYEARRQLRALQRAGLTRLVVSYDTYHADFQGAGPVRHIAAAARALGVPLSVTMVRSTGDPPDLIEILHRTQTDTGARVRVYDLQPVGRGRDLAPPGAADTEGFCAASAFPAIANDGRVMACNGPAYFERPSSPLVLGSLADTPLETLIARHEQDPILDTIRTKGPAGLRDELARMAGFDAFPRRQGYRGICDLCHEITRDERAVAALRERLARPDLAAARRAAWQVIAGSRTQGAISSSYVNGPGACRIFLNAAWQPGVPLDEDAARILGSAHLDWRQLAKYLGGSGLARPLAWIVDHPALTRWAPTFFLEALGQRAVADGLRELVQRDLIAEAHDVLQALGARGVLLKGAAVSCRTPSGRTPRATADIDLLVAGRASAEELHARLKRRGFVSSQGSDAETYHHLEPLSRQGMTIEIHTRLMAGYWGLPEHELLAGCQPARPEWPALDTLNAEALAFHAIVHTSSSFYSYGLKTAWDLRVLAEAFPSLDWTRLAGWAGMLRAPRVFWIPLRLLSRELDTGVSGALVGLAPADPGARRIERVAAERLFRAADALRELDAATKAGLMLLMHHNLAGKARYLGAKVWWRGTRPATWGAALRRARDADLARQAWRNYRRYVKHVKDVSSTSVLLCLLASI
jgi:pyruvate-formate lyase-activating enzyme